MDISEQEVIETRLGTVNLKKTNRKEGVGRKEKKINWHLCEDVITGNELYKLGHNEIFKFFNLLDVYYY